MEEGPERELFAKTMAALGVALNRDVDEFTIGVYWKAMRHVPVPLVVRSATEMVATMQYFPKPVEWLSVIDGMVAEDVRAEAEKQIAAQPALPPGDPVSQEPYNDCNVCEDTCREHFWCDPTSEEGRGPSLEEFEDARTPIHQRVFRRKWCGRRDCKTQSTDGRFTPHLFVEWCACYPHNPTYRRRNPPKAPKYSKIPKGGEERGRREAD